MRKLLFALFFVFFFCETNAQGNPVQKFLPSEITNDITNYSNTLLEQRLFVNVVTVEGSTYLYRVKLKDSIIVINFKKIEVYRPEPQNKTESQQVIEQQKQITQVQILKQDKEVMDFGKQWGEIHSSEMLDKEKALKRDENYKGFPMRKEALELIKTYTLEQIADQIFSLSGSETLTVSRAFIYCCNDVKHSTKHCAANKKEMEKIKKEKKCCSYTIFPTN